MYRKLLYIPVVAIAVFVVGLMFLIKGCLTVYNTQGVVGPPVISSDGKKLLVLIVESEATSRQENGGYRSTSYRNSYWLKLYNTQSGSLIQKKQLRFNKGSQNIVPVLYGGFGDTVWFHTDGLKAYSINSLEEIIEEKNIIAQNQFDPALFPYEERFIYDAVQDGSIFFTATNADKYRIDLRSLAISKIEAKDASDKNEEYKEFMEVFRKKNSIGKRCNLQPGKVQLLATDSVGASSVYPDFDDDSRVYKRLYLFEAGYTTRQLGNHLSYTYTNIKKLSDSGFISGIFLKDAKTGLLAEPTGPGSVLIAHHSNISADAKMILTAIEKSKGIIWRTVTEMSIKMELSAVNDRYIVLAGNKKELTGPYMGLDLLAITDLKTGRIVYPNIAE